MASSVTKNLFSGGGLASHLYLNEKNITTQLEYMVIQFKYFLTMKLERVNKALDKVMPLRIHRKLVAIGLTYTSMLMHVLSFFLNIALMFISVGSWNPKKISTGLDSNGSQVFKLEDYMKCKAEKVNKALVELLPENGSSEKICESMAYSLLSGGKRIRPILCIAACEFVGGKDSSAMPLACAMEIIHTSSLIIDDLPCMDDDDLRRGNPSSHKKYGEGVAILTSTALTCLAFEHIVAKTQNVSQYRMVQAISELVSAVGLDGLVSGQFMDLDCEGKEVALEKLKSIHVLKTGRLLEAAVVCGAIIGGAQGDEIERLRKYAYCIGLLFQVVDDILDETQSAEKLGKTAGKDLASDKATFPKLLGLDGAKQYAKELVDQAVQELGHFDSARAAPLYHLAHFILNRPW